MRWSWIAHNHAMILTLLSQHIRLAIIPVVLGLALSLPIGYAATRWGVLYRPLLVTSGLLYSIPSLALFVILPVIIGTTILQETNIVVALTIYTVALLARTVVDGLRSVPENVQQAATAMGFGRLRRLAQVELPVAVPVIFSGLRVATVANVSLVNVGALIGIGGLGQLLTDGFHIQFWTEIITGVGLSVALALFADTLIVLLQRRLTPWVRAAEAR